MIQRKSYHDDLRAYFFHSSCSTTTLTGSDSHFSESDEEDTVTRR